MKKPEFTHMLEVFTADWSTYNELLPFRDWKRITETAMPSLPSYAAWRSEYERYLRNRGGMWVLSVRRILAEDLGSPPTLRGVRNSESLVLCGYAPHEAAEQLSTQGWTVLNPPRPQRNAIYLQKTHSGLLARVRLSAELWTKKKGPGQEERFALCEDTALCGLTSDELSPKDCAPIRTDHQRRYQWEPYGALAAFALRYLSESKWRSLTTLAKRAYDDVMAANAHQRNSDWTGVFRHAWGSARANDRRRDVHEDLLAALRWLEPQGVVRCRDESESAWQVTDDIDAHEKWVMANPRLVEVIWDNRPEQHQPADTQFMQLVARRPPVPKPETKPKKAKPKTKVDEVVAASIAYEAAMSDGTGSAEEMSDGQFKTWCRLKRALAVFTLHAVSTTMTPGKNAELAAGDWKVFRT